MSVRQARNSLGFLLAVAIVIALMASFGVRVPAQQGVLSDAELKNLATSAKTAQDHTRLAAHYKAHAVEHETDAKLHEQLANQYDKTSPQLAGEARHYAAHSQEAAEALRNLSKIHDSMAKGGK